MPPWGIGEEVWVFQRDIVILSLDKTKRTVPNRKSTSSECVMLTNSPSLESKYVTKSISGYCEKISFEFISLDIPTGVVTSAGTVNVFLSSRVPLKDIMYGLSEYIVRIV